MSLLIIEGGTELTKEQIKNLMSKDAIQDTKNQSLEKDSPSKDHIEPGIDA